MNIQEALLALDPKNDQHWTDAGLPRLSELKRLTGNDSLTRSDVNDVDSEFHRDMVGVVHDVLDDIFGESSDDAAEEQPEPAVEPRESVLGLPLPQILGDPEVARQALQELNGLQIEAANRLKAVKAEQAQLAAQVAVVERAVERHRRAMGSEDDASGVRAYLERQRQVREERAARRKAFIESGVTAGEVAAELRGQAPIDAAMNARGNSRGTSRPQMRVPR